MAGQHRKGEAYRKGADGVDGELVDLSVRHDGQICRVGMGGRVREEGSQAVWAEGRLCTEWVAPTLP
jgi:hypothetical protein